MELFEAIKGRRSIGKVDLKGPLRLHSHSWKGTDIIRPLRRGPLRRSGSKLMDTLKRTLGGDSANRAGGYSRSGRVTFPTSILREWGALETKAEKWTRLMESLPAVFAIFGKRQALMQEMRDDT